MKKLLAAILIAAFAPALFAQEGPSLKVSGEVKSGVYWEQYQYQGWDKNVEIGGEPAKAPIKVHSTDNAGNEQGRFRLDLDYDNGKNFGMRSRIQWENWTNTDSEQPLWQYAFGYGNFFEDQLTVAVGKLGASPWGLNGPDMWRDLEQYKLGGGMRIEWKPAFISNGLLNVGFVLNWFDGGEKENRTATLADFLRESVLGISYAHDLFAARLAYRMDSEFDIENGNNRGDELVFHLEERALNGVVPGMKLWVIGWYRGLFAKDSGFNNLMNWVYFEYDPPELFNLDTPFTAQLRFGFDYVGFDYDGVYAETKYEIGPLKGARGEFHISPSFYWHFFEKLLDVGLLFSYRQDFGENKVWPGSPYQRIELEPKVQLNLATAYIALAYNWKMEYIPGGYERQGSKDPTRQTQSINLRFCIYY